MNEFEDKKEIGKIKKEYDIKKIIILGAKIYAFQDFQGNEYIKAKGLITSKLKFEDFEKALLTKEIKQNVEIIGFRNSLKRKLNGFFEFDMRNKKIKTILENYQKGKIIKMNEKQYRVEPFRLPEDLTIFEK